MTTEVIYEEEINPMNLSGGPCFRIKEFFRNFAGIEIDGCCRIAAINGKHGPAIVLYNPKFQAEWQKKQAQKQKE